MTAVTEKNDWKARLYAFGAIAMRKVVKEDISRETDTPNGLHTTLYVDSAREQFTHFYQHPPRANTLAEMEEISLGCVTMREKKEYI